MDISNTQYHCIARAIYHPSPITHNNIFKTEYEFLWDQYPLKDCNIEDIKHILTIEIGRWIWTIIKVKNKFYIWAVNLVQFVHYKWIPNTIWMFNFIIKYSPKSLFEKCRKQLLNLYIDYHKNETTSNDGWYN